MPLHLYAQPTDCLRPEDSPDEKPAPRELAAFQDRLRPLLEQDLGLGLVVLGLGDGQIALSPSLHFWRHCAQEFCVALRGTADLDAIRGRTVVEKPLRWAERMLTFLPEMAGAEYVHPELLDSLWEQMQNAVRRELDQSRKPAQQILEALGAKWHLAGQVHFHLVENRNAPERPFAFLATYSAKPEADGKVPHLPLRHALQQYGQDSKKLSALLATVQSAAARVPLVRQLLDSGKLFQPLAWSVDDAYRFLDTLPVLTECGILCRVPKWWGQRASAHVQVQVGQKAPAHFGLDALFAVEPKLWLEGTPLTEQEARELLAAKAGLALLKGNWVAVDKAQLQTTLEQFARLRKALAKGLTLREAMRLEAGLEEGTARTEEASYQIAYGDFLKSLLDKLRAPELIRGSKPSTRTFLATLRPYQQAGFDWMQLMHSLGLGACLADDMGLGKTVQVLAFLNHLLGKSSRPSLLVVPASLLPNWKSEAEKFAPRLRMHFAHAALNQTSQALQDALPATDLVVTSYGMLHRLEELNGIEWECVIADEAQALKNPGTRQAKAIRKLKARWRLAMTGTPVENRLQDLWALFDFLEPGLLGNAKEFTDSTARMQKRTGGYGALRQVLKPYILRRMKTDKSIIADLPDKVEANVYAGLSKAQAALYTQTLQELEKRLRKEQTGGNSMDRRALVFTTLLRLKQICNHPDLYHGASEFEEKDSGKLAVLRDICATIAEKREKVLIFTQFQEMCAPLAQFLRALFGREGCVLHGGTRITERKKAVQRFQEEPEGYTPWFVLSLKAGGTGLNLTGANHVIHFDRWWNPAVEDQATDRAFRIGQTRNVMVHKFVCRGTLEERIDAALADKRTLAKEIVGADHAGQWITEMDNQAILDMFRLDLQAATGE